MSNEGQYTSYTVEETQDEFGYPKFFVTNEDGDWVRDPFDSREAAYEEIERLKDE